ncbi:uncharacterized protein KGF55_002728 [Candida pseudojiufengensis]|uniref:uncharacterized protein n=1 Tax=Candida pseudojiufengensis TaxID=497109 RepID=UPI002224F297|nr:uncharacterized protein KGF55_002728 [Candida pseudojiufengensis]KAI5962936.1 hypothetical protein KGF55_002728 [Candida pseudojiufengensis]
MNEDDGEVKSYFVTIKLSIEALEAIELSQIQIKSPIKKQQASSHRLDQVMNYKSIITTENRNNRMNSRKGLSPEPKKLDFTKIKKVKFVD